MDEPYTMQGDGYRAECQECKGSGTVRVIIGDQDTTDRCRSCGGLGFEPSRKDFLRLDALLGDRELPGVPSHYRRAS